MNRDLAILKLMEVKGLGTKTFGQLLDRMKVTGIPPEEFIFLPVSEMAKIFGVKPAIAESIQRARTEQSRTYDEVIRHGVTVLARSNEGYPSKLAEVLKDSAPPVLFVKGNLGLIEKKGVGFCGSRKASEKGLRVAHECAVALAKENVNVVSGYAHGVDLAAHRGALEAGGVTTLVLAEGILQFKPKQELGDLLNNASHLVLSEFPPHLTWAVHNAMRRNETICGLSDAMIVIESGTTGGTFAAGKSALKLRRPLFVVEYAEPPVSAAGNHYFLERGAKALRGNKDGKPNVTELLRVVREGEAFHPHEPDLFTPVGDDVEATAVKEPSPKGNKVK
ncbi:MAG: DNA-processing protein DprA [Ignavibacteriae bacterium]|nr:DNA-processing protein DprA [Ignavibacteriota bacterium]